MGRYKDFSHSIAATCHEHLFGAAAAYSHFFQLTATYPTLLPTWEIWGHSNKAQESSLKFWQRLRMLGRPWYDIIFTHQGHIKKIWQIKKEGGRNGQEANFLNECSSDKF